MDPRAQHKEKVLMNTRSDDTTIQDHRLGLRQEGLAIDQDLLNPREAPRSSMDSTQKEEDHRRET